MLTKKFFNVEGPKSCKKCKGEMVWMDQRLYLTVLSLFGTITILFFGNRLGNHALLSPLLKDPSPFIGYLVVLSLVMMVGIQAYFQLFARRFRFICEKCGNIEYTKSQSWSPEIKAMAIVLSIGLTILVGLLIALIIVW